jgi:hypothetical protein
MTHGMLAGMKRHERAVKATYPWLGNPHLLNQDCRVHGILLKHLNHSALAGHSDTFRFGIWPSAQQTSSVLTSIIVVDKGVVLCIYAPFTEPGILICVVLEAILPHCTFKMFLNCTSLLPIGSYGRFWK